MHDRLRTAYIHIGAPKTGSTAIQASFSTAKDQLDQVGYHYLEGDRNHSEMLCLIFWSLPDAKKLGNLRWYDDEAEFLRHREELRNDLSEEIDRTAPFDLIISAEELSGFREHEVQDFVAFLQARFDRLRVIAYAREPQSWMTSASQQNIKFSGDTLDAIFQRPRLPNYQRRFKSFIHAVGRENFDLRIFDVANEQFNVVSDFAKAIGIDDKFESLLDAGRENLSISHHSAILLSVANAEMPPFIGYRYNPFRASGFVDECRIPGPKFTLPRETVLAVSDTLQEERDWLNEMFSKSAFVKPALPETSLDTWYGSEKENLERFAIIFLNNCRRAQNERALAAFLRSMKSRNTDPELARKELASAWSLSTDRWSMHIIATEAVEVSHPDRKRIFAKQRIMNRFEAPKANDPPLAIGNPFDRNP
ncbi:MAG: hypothetical protein WBA92_01660 [Pseudorhodobacter sp.]